MIKVKKTAMKKFIGKNSNLYEINTEYTVSSRNMMRFDIFQSTARVYVLMKLKASVKQRLGQKELTSH